MEPYDKQDPSQKFGILANLAAGNFKEAMAGIAAMQSEIDAILATPKEELPTDNSQLSSRKETMKRYTANSFVAAEEIVRHQAEDGDTVAVHSWYLARQAESLAISLGLDIVVEVDTTIKPL